MFIVKRYTDPLEFRRNDMFIVKRRTNPLEFRRNGIEKQTYRPYQINAKCAFGICRD